MEVGMFITLFLIALGIIRKHSRIIALCQVIWIWIIMAFNNGGMDYKATVEVYQTYIHWYSGIYDWLARYIVSTIHKRYEMEFWQYNILIMTVVIVILFVFILKNTENCSLYFSFFLVYPFADSVIQKRFFVAMVLCMIALVAIQKGKRKQAALFIIMAIGFHSTAVVMVIYLFMDGLLGKYRRIIYGIFSLEIILLLNFKDILSWLLSVDFFRNIAIKASYYGEFNISTKAGIMFIISQLGFVALTVLIETPGKLQLHSVTNQIRDNFFVRINIFSLVFLPFLMFDAVFWRFYRIIMLVSYLSIVDKIRGRWLVNTKTFYLSCIYFILLVAFVCTLISTDKAGWEGFLETLFKYNSLLQ